MTSDPAAIEIRNCGLRLGFSSGEAIQFHLEHFKVDAGEQIALTGPSGCGKSTLLNLVAGLRRPDAGSIVVRGTDLKPLSASKLDAFRGRTMGFVFQSFNLLDGFSALENVLVGLRFGRSCPHGERRARAVALLERVGLQRRLDSLPGRMSVGERQRVAIARALANRPAILLADEPTGALDPATADEVFGLIREVCGEERCALVLVTHDLDLAAKLPRQVDCRGLIRHVSEMEVSR
ncbi:MAG: ABC transporter ATP-binding protein [Luteolibacter sp.]